MVKCKFLPYLDIEGHKIGFRYFASDSVYYKCVVYPYSSAVSVVIFDMNGCSYLEHTFTGHELFVDSSFFAECANYHRLSLVGCLSHKSENYLICCALVRVLLDSVCPSDMCFLIDRCGRIDA